LIALEFRSRVAAPPDVVWRVVATMDGVNAELAPWLRMTHPPDRADLRAQMVPPGEVVFHSWLLLLGVLPVDRHALSFESLHERGFDERSTSWSNRIWIHRRRVAGDGPIVVRAAPVADGAAGAAVRRCIVPPSPCAAARAIRYPGDLTTVDGRS
jgi:hypothetical protein